MYTEVLIQVYGDLAVRVRSKPMSAPLQLPSLVLEVIKLTIHSDVNPFVLVCDRLITGHQVNNAQPHMTKTGALVRGKPGALAVRTAVTENFGHPIEFLP